MAVALTGACLSCATVDGLPVQEALPLRWEHPTSSTPFSIVVDDLGRPALYAALGEGGLAILDSSDPARPPREVGRVTKSQLGGLDAMYATQQGRFVYVALGNFFDARGSPAGLAVVNVDDPRAPVVSGTWTSSETVGGAATVLVDGDVAYLGAMEAGVFVLDVADRSRLQLLASFLPDIHFPRAQPTAVQHPNARGMAVRESLLYVAYDAGGLRVIDVRDPSRPAEIARYINARMPAKQQAYNHVTLGWPYAYLGVDYCGMEVLDVRDPARIRQVAWWNPWRCDLPSNMWFNSPGHANQLVLEGGRIFLSAGDGELQVIDVSRPDRPQLVARFGRPKDGQGAWGVTVAGGTAYLGYVTTLIPFRGTWTGIRAVAAPPR